MANAAPTETLITCDTCGARLRLVLVFERGPLSSNRADPAWSETRPRWIYTGEAHAIESVLMLGEQLPRAFVTRCSSAAV